MGFALTKIQPPRPRAGLVERRALEAMLDDALAHKRLTLLCAPAGFGKTAALTRQRDRLPAGAALAWVGADEGDDLQRLFECLLAALEPCDLPWRSAPEAWVQAVGGAAPRLREVSTALLNALAASDVARGLIVFDDLHRVVDPAVYRFIDLLLERLPETWGLAISSRVEPPLAIARLRARDELAEFRQEQLRFGADDAAALVASLPGAPTDVAALLARTGGWAAGLRLVLGKAANRCAGADGSHEPEPAMDRHVFDFLSAEVLADMPPELRSFLLSCSVLHELTAERCAAVSGDARAALWLDEIERRGLFVSALEGAQTTLALHDLFRDCLQDCLRRERPQDLPLLLRRAAAGEADPVRRVGYLARAAAWDEAETVLYSVGPALIASGAVPQVLRLLAQFPALQREQSPRLLELRGLCAWMHWDWLMLRATMQRAVAGHHAAGDRNAALRGELILATVAVAAESDLAPTAALLQRLQQAPLEPYLQTLTAFVASWLALASSRLDEVTEPFTRLVGLLERQADPVLWLQCAPPTAFLGLPGTRPALQRWVHGALRLASGEGTPALRVLARALQAGLMAFGGDTDGALSVLAEADAECRWFNQPPVQATYISTVAALAQALHGKRDAALAAAQALLDGLDDPRTSGRRLSWRGHYLYLRLRVAAVLDDEATQREMAALLAQHRDPEERVVFLRQRSSLAARLAALDGRWADAAAGFTDALQDEVALDHYGQAGELRLRLAHAQLMLGHADAAATAMRTALQRALDSGEVAPLRLAGLRALRTLAAQPWGARLPAAELAPLQAAAALHADTATALPAAAAAAEGPLSAREAEVLEQIAAGASNKLIARALDLSPHTVKRHVANLLDKLALSTRGEAAAWWHARHPG